MNHPAPSIGQRKISDQQSAPQRRKSAPAMPRKTTDLSEEERLFIARLRIEREKNGINNTKNSEFNNVQNPPIQRKKKVSFMMQADEPSLSTLAEEEEY